MMIAVIPLLTARHSVSALNKPEIPCAADQAAALAGMAKARPTISRMIGACVSAAALRPKAAVPIAQNVPIQIDMGSPAPALCAIDAATRAIKRRQSVERQPDKQPAEKQGGDDQNGNSKHSVLLDEQDRRTRTRPLPQRSMSNDNSNEKSARETVFRLPPDARNWEKGSALERVIFAHDSCGIAVILTRLGDAEDLVADAEDDNAGHHRSRHAQTEMLRDAE
jgi:hypothetical protein